MKSRNLELNYDKIKYIYFFVFVFIFCLDRISKFLALSNYFSCELVINRGVSWSFLHSEDERAFFIVSLLVLIIIIFLIIHTKIKFSQKKNILAEVLILSGAISNFIDRIVYSGVVDFIVITLGNYNWPIFNFADISIVIGSLFLLIELFYA